MGSKRNTAVLLVTILTIVVIFFLLFGAGAWMTGIPYGDVRIRMAGLNLIQIPIGIGLGFLLGFLLARRQW